jgi:hypothetical protein
MGQRVQGKDRLTGRLPYAAGDAIYAVLAAAFAEKSASRLTAQLKVFSSQATNL